MAGTTLIDYALSKVQGIFVGLISWDEEDLSGVKEEERSKTNVLNKLVNKALETNKGRIFADVKISESHRFTSNITDQTLEDGSSIHEHVIPELPTVTLQIEETNNTLASKFSGGYFGPQQTFDKLVELWKNAVPLTITTQHKQYKNMVISNMPILHRAPYLNALQITVDLKQLEFVHLETVVYEGKTEDITMAASEEKSGGLQKATEFTQVYA